MVVDYRKVNDISIKNVYPLPQIDHLITKLKGAKYFSALDVRSGYYNIRMHEGDEWKTAFSTPRGMFESLVMTFGLTNTPATFQTMMDSIFITFIRRGVAGAFIDDVGIGTGSDPTSKLSDEEYHIKVVKEIFQVFREHHLSLKAEKCVLLKKEIHYLGHIISGEHSRPDPIKLAGIRNWPPPTKLKELRQFLGLMNYYRRYILNFSSITHDLHLLLQKETAWTWDKPQQTAFEELKAAMLKAPVLAHPDYERPYLPETDASGVAIGAVLSQQQDDGKWHPVDYLSKSFSPAEKNYATHDQELLVIIVALKQWQHLLMGAKYPVEVLTNHANLRYFREKQNLNARQCRWAVYLENLHLNIRYRPGKQSSIPDALSRQPDHGENPKEEETLQRLLPENWFSEQKTYEQVNLIEPYFSSPPTIEKLLLTAQAQDPLILKFNGVKEGEEVPAHWSVDERNFWTYWGKIYVPENMRQTIFRTLHTNPIAGHPGRDTTLFSI